MIKKIGDFIMDLIFPIFCLSCGKEGKWLCAACKQKIVKISTQVCPACGRISALGRYCLRCRKKNRFALSGIIASVYYEEGPIKEMIHNFKYNHILEMGSDLGELMVTSLKENKENIGSEIIVTAVPLYFLRKAQRGFNQSEILAEIVANKINLPKNFKILKKIHQTVPQVKYSGEKRRENLKNSFKIIDKSAVKNRTIVLVDDVTTTGTTLDECAWVLKEAGAKKVWGLVVARG